MTEKDSRPAEETRIEIKALSDQDLDRIAAGGAVEDTNFLNVAAGYYQAHS